jgi:hypothetical protein
VSASAERAVPFLSSVMGYAPGLKTDACMASPVASAMIISALLYTQSFSEDPILDPIIHGSISGRDGTSA